MLGFQIKLHKEKLRVQNKMRISLHCFRQNPSIDFVRMNFAIEEEAVAAVTGLAHKVGIPVHTSSLAVEVAEVDNLQAAEIGLPRKKAERILLVVIRSCSLLNKNYFEHRPQLVSLEGKSTQRIHIRAVLAGKSAYSEGKSTQRANIFAALG